MVRVIAIVGVLAIFGSVAANGPASARRVPESQLAAFIDAEIHRRLAESGTPPSPPADDAEFLRRVTLDLTGTVPTLERVKSFLADHAPDKRVRLIDELLASPAFGRHLAEQWADLLIKRDFDANRALKTEPFIRWLAESINGGTGWDAIVRELVTASGSEADNPAALFVLANQDMFQPSPAKLAAATSNLFLGISLHCAECHEHPTVPEWKPQDFWGLAAFYGHLRFERDGNLPAPKNPNPVKLVEIERRSEPRSRLARRNGERAIEPGAVIAIPDPTDNTKSIGTAPAKYFGGAAPRLLSVPYRPALADWLTAPENSLFARAAVNRLWALMFARGLVHPLEEMHDGNPATHPAILQTLADDFARSGFDLRRVLRTIALSAAYQRTSKPTDANAEDTTLLSHMPVKVLGPRELLASIAKITGVRERSPDGARRPVPAVKRPGPQSLERFFDTREYDDDPMEYSFGVPQMLKQMNSSLTLRSRDVAARLARANSGDRDRTIHDLYLTILGRPPRSDELARMGQHVARQKDALTGFGDVAWALLISAEFVSNH